VIAEFALALPILLLLLAGAVEVSRVIYQYHVVAKSVQVAARFLARREELRASGECPPAGNWAEAVAKARTLALRGSLSASADFVLPHWTDPATVTVTVRCQAAGIMVSPLGTGPGTALPIIEVSATVPFNDVGLLGLLGVNTVNIVVSHSEMGVGG